MNDERNIDKHKAFLYIIYYIQSGCLDFICSSFLVWNWCPGVSFPELNFLLPVCGHLNFTYVYKMFQY